LRSRPRLRSKPRLDIGRGKFWPPRLKNEILTSEAEVEVEAEAEVQTEARYR